MVAHLLWEQEVGGSNPPSPTHRDVGGDPGGCYRLGGPAGVAQRLEPQPSKLVVRVRFPSPAPLVLTKRVVLNTSQKLILGAAGALFATSAFLAVAQPGDLGGDDDDSAAPAATTTTTISESTSTTTGGDTTTTTAPGATTETTEAGTTDTTDTTVAGSTESTVTTVAGSGGTTPTTRPSSGIGAGGAGSVGDDIADTGHESMLAGGLALLGLGLLVRRAATPRIA